MGGRQQGAGTREPHAVRGPAGEDQAWVRVRRRLALRASRRCAAFAFRRRAALGFS